MEEKSKITYPMDSEDVWFKCKCGIKDNDSLEEIVPPEKIKGSLEWAYSPTSDKDRWDALEKLRIREEYEAKERKSKG